MLADAALSLAPTGQRHRLAVLGFRKPHADLYADDIAANRESFGSASSTAYTLVVAPASATVDAILAATRIANGGALNCVVGVFVFVLIHCADADGGVFRFDSAAPTTFTLRAGTSIATLESSLPVQRVSPELNLLARAATFRARLAFAFCRLDRSLPPGLTSLRCRSFS